MTLRPCLDCGEPAAGTRCPEHTVDTKASATERGYDWRWTKLSRQARKLQPFCTDCGTTDDLQGDHTPEAWARKAAGKTIRPRDIVIRCGSCNRDAGAARGPSATRGHARSRPAPDPSVGQNPRYTPVESLEIAGRVPAVGGDHLPAAGREVQNLSLEVNRQHPTLEKPVRVVVGPSDGDVIGQVNGECHTRSLP